MTRISRRARIAVFAVTTALCSGLAAPAWAESPHPNRDGNGVDLTTGEFNLQLPIASIGSGQATLPLIAYSGTTDNWTQASLNKSSDGSTIDVLLGDTSDRFIFVGSATSAVSSRGTGATLDVSGSGATYRSQSGVVITFAGEPEGDHVSNLCSGLVTTSCTMLADTMSGRSGLTVTFGWDVHAHCATVFNDDGTINCTDFWRLASVSNDAGYSINWTFASNAAGGLHSNPAPAWFQRTSAQFQNENVSAASWPTVTYASPSAGVYTFTNPASETWRITTTGGLVTGVRRPSASSDTTTIAYSSGKVNSVTSNGVATGYSYSVSGTTATMVVTDALSNATTIVSDLAKYRATQVTSGAGKVTTMTYDSLGQPTEVAFPEGNKVQYGYDTRGNLTMTTLKAKAGSGLSDIVTSALYDTSCTNPATCDRPTWTKDALGNRTDYTYDSTTGQVLTVTAPAATTSANRPKTTYSYSTVAGVQALTGTSTCRTNASCAGTSDEVKTTVAYDSNLNPTSVSSGAGDGSLTATSAATYDALGNLITVDGPLSGSGDTTTFRYDAARRRTGSISADPDGAGSLKRRAVRTTYNADGQPTVTETGTVTGTSDTDWAAFVSLQQVTATYDANAYKTKDVLTASSTTYGVTQYSYDADGRIECAATRMNSSAWGSLPSSACTAQIAGSYGPDRIVKATYDAVGRVTKVQSAYGITGVQADEATATFTDNGRTATATDAEGNKTSYTYDGFDRLSKTFYPSTTKGAGASSTTDYEQLTYDANDNVVSRRLRDATSIGYSYDNLGRVTLMDLSGSGIDQDITYTYDLQGRLLTSVNPWGHLTNYGYDALGRAVSEQTTYGGVKASRYDLAGRRTRLTWEDGFYVDYDYDAVGEMTAVRENGATSGVGVLATYAYDDLGRRTGLTRGNGVTTSYGYDAASRLTSLANDLAGTTYDQTYSYSYNPAGQIASRTSSNDAYAWTGAVNVARGYTSNGLNQFTASGGTSLGYDARGNLNSSGSDSYGYSQRNQLAGYATGTLYYDPPGRLDLIYGTGVATTFDYDGGRLMTEGTYQVTAYARRYVFGAGTDEPLVWYEGSGTSDRRWLAADERGSVVAVTNASGTATAINTYDESGIPGSGNLGRFQYTGQIWLAELGMYYYKARLYSPTLGRFLQTDPIGYGDGMNWYNYVGSDPVNFADPSGMNGGNNCLQLYEWHGEKYADGSVKWLYSVPFTSICYDSSQGLSGGGNGGRNGGKKGNGGDDSEAGDIVITATVSKSCRQLQRNTDSTKNILPSYVTSNDNWNNPSFVQGYKNLYQDSYNQYKFVTGPVGGIIVAGAGIACKFIAACKTSVFVGTAGATASGGGIAGYSLPDLRDSTGAAVRALDARLQELASGCF